MEMILSALVLTGIFYILYLQIKSKRRKEQGSGILLRQSPIFSILGSACIIADIVIVIVLLTCESEGIIAAYMIFFIFFIPGIIFLISNRKTVRILENKIIYCPIIGKKKEISIDDFSYIIRKSQYAAFYAYGNKRICQLNFLMDNYWELIMFLEDHGVECKYELGEMLQEYVVRPGKAYFVIGIGLIAFCIILGISILMDEEARFVAVYILMFLLLVSFYGLGMLIFYFRKKIILKEDEFIIYPVIGKAKKWSYSQVSLVRIDSNQGMSRPIALFAGQKKIVQIVFAYSGYFMFERMFEDKCSDVMEYC